MAMFVLRHKGIAAVIIGCLFFVALLLVFPLPTEPDCIFTGGNACTQTDPDSPTSSPAPLNRTDALQQQRLMKLIMLAAVAMTFGSMSYPVLQSIEKRRTRGSGDNKL